eukprot:UC4_evm1s1333
MKYGEELEEACGRASLRSVGTSKADDENELFKATKPYFWLDIFTVNQFEAPQYPQSFWTDTFKEQVREIGHTLLVLHPWNAPIPLTRAWCGWEMYCTLDTHANMDIRLPLCDSRALEKALAAIERGTLGFIRSVDTQKSEAWKSADQHMIHEAVKCTVGFVNLNKMVQERMEGFLKFHLETATTVFFTPGQTVAEKFSVVDSKLSGKSIHLKERQKTNLERAKTQRLHQRNLNQVSEEATRVRTETSNYAVPVLLNPENPEVGPKYVSECTVFSSDYGK